MYDYSSYEHIIIEVKDGVALLTINRPEVYNAFRGRTAEEMLQAFSQAGWDKGIAVIV
ncbi:MAG: enoyl-CoA hydratase-related protein, partial [Dehalococcoidia bacterium]|nr:enoyl-CoA hydratase-related protein [Dehalococcoidia bacterium]